MLAPPLAGIQPLAGLPAAVLRVRPQRVAMDALTYSMSTVDYVGVSLTDQVYEETNTGHPIDGAIDGGQHSVHARPVQDAKPARGLLQMLDDFVESENDLRPGHAVFGPPRAGKPMAAKLGFLHHRQSDTLPDPRESFKAAFSENRSQNGSSRAPTTGT